MKCPMPGTHRPQKFLLQPSHFQATLGLRLGEPRTQGSTLCTLTAPDPQAGLEQEMGVTGGLRKALPQRVKPGSQELSAELRPH